MNLFNEMIQDDNAVIEVSAWNSNSTVYVKAMHEMKRLIGIKDDYVYELAKSTGGKELSEFYSTYSYLKFCRFFIEGRGEEILVHFVPAQQIRTYTEALLPGGKYSFAIDFTKSNTLYRDEHNGKWIIFAKTGGGWLSLFLEGKYAGQIFYVTPEPHFNNLRPIAKSFHALLNRMVTDPAKFLRLTGSLVPIPLTPQESSRMSHDPKWGFVRAVAYHANSARLLNSKYDA